MQYAKEYLDRHHFQPRIDVPVAGPDTRFIAVIPCYNEPLLFHTLENILACDPPESKVEIIVVLNAPANADDKGMLQNGLTAGYFREWRSRVKKSWLEVHMIDITERRGKNAGVGLARKTGMDEAVHRFWTVNAADGIILSLDADVRLEKNYFTSIENRYSSSPGMNGCNIYFEHDLRGPEFDPEVYAAAASYELYLRHYIEAMRYSGFPYAMHTVGSCFTVSCKAYVRQGGMNRKQGGEDFYFLHKLFPLGHFSTITDTTIHLSPRPSSRVPFGTGPAVTRLLNGGMQETYELSAFDDLKTFFGLLPEIYDTFRSHGFPEVSLPLPLKHFLDEASFHDVLTEIVGNVSGFQTFRKRFFHWFNAFRLFRYLNQVHKKDYKKVPVTHAATQLLESTGESPRGQDLFELLAWYRRIQKKAG